MYSVMSSRTIARSSSNMNSASARASSVLPTPVGPRKTNEPIGRFGSCRPERARRSALETASIASSWPTTRWCRRSSMCTSFSTSPSSSRLTGIPVQVATTAATSSSSTSSFTIGSASRAAFGTGAVGSVSSPAPRVAPLHYVLKAGDILTYGQVLETENTLEENREATYRVRMEWQVKIYVLAQDEDSTSLAIQYNLRGAEISRRAGLERLVGKDKAREILEIYDNLAPELVRFLKVDGFGRDRSAGYNFNSASSSVYSFMTRIARLPDLALEDGRSVLTREESELDVTYQGESRESRASLTVSRPGIRAARPCSSSTRTWASRTGWNTRRPISPKTSSGGRAIRSSFARSAISAGGLLQDPLVNKALVLGSFVRPELACGREVIQAFLDSADPERQNLAAAYCALRGIPDGLDIRSYLTAPNPLVRFNAAKALLQVHRAALPMIAADARLRAVHPPAGGVFFLPQHGRLAAGHSRSISPSGWMYEGGDLPDEFGADRGRAARHAGFVIKPPNARPSAAATGNFLGAAGPDDRHPYYLSLPADYDPAETFPMIVYLGMGDGRGDYAFQSVYNGLRAEGAACRGSSCSCPRPTANGGTRAWRRWSTASCGGPQDPQRRHQPGLPGWQLQRGHGHDLFRHPPARPLRRTGGQHGLSRGRPALPGKPPRTWTSSRT